MRANLNELKYEDIKVGDIFSLERFIDEASVDKFADLSGDYNPLHMDEQYAKKTEFKERIVHGMLLASLFSNLVGMKCAGKGSLYLSQDLHFKKALPMNNKVKVEGKVVTKIDSVKIIEMKTVIKDSNNNLLVDGIARVKVRE